MSSAESLCARRALTSLGRQQSSRGSELSVRWRFPAQHMMTTHARALQPAADAPRQPIAPQRRFKPSLRLDGTESGARRAARAANGMASGHNGKHSRSVTASEHGLFPPQLSPDRSRAGGHSRSRFICSSFSGL